MSSHRCPITSIVLATHNRRAVVTNTLSQITRCGLDRKHYEIIVVDNNSIDGTPAAIESGVDLLISLRRNAGSCGKANGVDRARGKYIVFLDDDSFPRPGALLRMIERFEADARLGAAGFTVHLPNGQREGAALPGVFVGCGVGLRLEALREVGGLDRSFFMQAEEYDLCFRLANNGWKTSVFDDLHVEHLKTDHSRRSDRTTYYDIRNNLRVIARYLPTDYARAYHEDCLQRYRWLAIRDGHERAFARGARNGQRRAILERWLYRRRRLSSEVFERFYGLQFIGRQMTQLKNSGVRRVILADLGKNVFSFFKAGNDAGISISAIADDRFASPGRSYRGISVASMEQALAREHDAVVVSNTGPEHAARTQRLLAARASKPVHSWFSAGETAEVNRIASPSPIWDSDDIGTGISEECALPVGGGQES